MCNFLDKRNKKNDKKWGICLIKTQYSIPQTILYNGLKRQNPNHHNNGWDLSNAALQCENCLLIIPQQKPLLLQSPR